ALHAAELVFKHPITTARMSFASEWPEDLRESLALARESQGQVAPAAGLTYFDFFRYRSE
ncbi:MAG TPA: hypothetical protein VGP87_08750, partial [Gemmatimonadales bacterium]|nr:hypothetical protein [Gemmatimonadales bacterium]